MARKGESIFKRKDGRYEGRYIKEYKDGKAVYGYVYGRTYSECKKKRNLYLSNLHIEKPKTTRRIKGIKTLNDLVVKWLENKENIKLSSYTRYFNLINQHIKNDIGMVKVSKLNDEIINKYLQSKLDSGKLDKSGGLSKNTVYDICNILKQVFNENNIKIEMIKISKKIGTGKSLYADEKKQLVKSLNKTDSSITIGIMLSLLLGIRESEVCGIRISDIDINNKVIYINRIVSRVKSFNTRNKTKLILSTPKTEKSIRILPIPDKLYNDLCKIKNNYNDDNYLLTGKNKFMDPRTFYNHYKRFTNQLNLNYTYHDLRHTFATDCIDIGIDYKTLMELLGHSNITTTMNIYVHPTINSKRSFINKL